MCPCYYMTESHCFVGLSELPQYLSLLQKKKKKSVGTIERIIPVLLLSAGIRAYEQLGFRAFGTPGKMATGIAITLQNIGCEVPA